MVDVAVIDSGGFPKAPFTGIFEWTLLNHRSGMFNSVGSTESLGVGDGYSDRPAAPN
jgi:hypothetical protein